MQDTQDQKQQGVDVHSGVVHPWQLDQFNHLNVRWYGHFFDDASFLYWTQIGLNLSALQKEHGVHTVTASAKTEFKSELLAGDCIRISALATRIGGKSVTLEFRMRSLRTGAVHATYETVEVFVDAETHRSVAIPDAVRQALAG